MPLTRLTTAVAAALLAALAACRGAAPSTARAALEGELAASASWADSLTAATASATDERRIGAQEVVAAGYLERLRLGLGSPFRLVDYAARDPRLSDSVRTRLALALLARTRSGEAYSIDPSALASVGGRGREWEPANGVFHRTLIERAVEGARDPRAGELAVRLAYVMSRAEGEVGRSAFGVTAQVAALVRDRALARRDVAALLDEAGRTGERVVDLVPVWRATGRFLVERPPLAPLAPEVEAEAMRAALPLATALRSPGAHDQPARGDPPAASRPALGAAAARRLAGLASVRGAPPQATVTVPLRTYRARLLDGRYGGVEELAARARFVQRARTEETLAAEYGALVAARGAQTTPALALLSAAVAMRSYAQEPVWFPQFGGPTVAQLRDRWGITSVSFDAGVPAEWRPHYLRLLATGIADLQRVMPALQLRGVGVHFGESVLRDSALALHDPRTRTVYLPVSTAGGTLAHELAHDLDWQVSRERFGTSGGYSTDRAVREQRGRMAASLRGLTAATLVPPAPENHYRPPHDRRPAEVFARNADWFVAVALAREGRTNGYLTAVQDEVLTGYAGVTPPDVDGGAALAVADLLDDMTFIAPPTRSWFLSQYGRGRPLGAYDLVRRTLMTPADSLVQVALADATSEWSATALASGVLPVAGGRLSACDHAGDSRAALERRLVERAAEARARGLLRTAAFRTRWDAAAPVSLRALAGGPWAPELATDAVARVQRALLARLDARDAAERPFGTASGCRGT